MGIAPWSIGIVMRAGPVRRAAFGLVVLLVRPLLFVGAVFLVAGLLAAVFFVAFFGADFIAGGIGIRILTPGMLIDWPTDGVGAAAITAPIAIKIREVLTRDPMPSVP